MKNDAVQEFVKVNDLTHADWNPRTVDELKPEHPAMKDLVESVKALGVIQPIVVWVRNVDGERQATVIAGNRRAEAAKIAGVERVPALVYADGELTLEEAQSITRSENEVRLGVDPILDSQLIKRMLDQGMSQQEIAAKLGTSEATVCRRVKLCGLSEDFVKLWREHSDRISVKALEAIAVHSDIQDELFKDLRYQASGSVLTHEVVISRIRSITQKIDEGDWMFKSPIGADLLASCRCCAHNTGTQADLFRGDFANEGDACRCEDCACFKRMCTKARDAIIREKVGDGTPFVLVNGEWNLPEIGGRKSKVNCVAYVAWNDWNHKIEKVKFAPPKDVIEAQERRQEEDRKAARKAEDEARARLAKAREPIDAAFGYGNRDKLLEVAADTILTPYKLDDEKSVMVEIVRAALNSYSYGFNKVAILIAFPDFAEKLGVSEAMMKEFQEADRALNELQHADDDSSDDREDDSEESEEE